MPCTEEPGGGTVMGLQRVGHDWAHSTRFEFWRNTRVSVFRPLPAVPAVVWINARFTLDPSASVKCLLLYTHHVWLPWKPLLTLPLHWFCKGPISICLILQGDIVLKYVFYFCQKPGAPWCEELNVENYEGLEILSCLPPNKLVCHSSMEADRGVGTPGSGTEDILTDMLQAPWASCLSQFLACNPESHRSDAEQPRWVLHTWWACRSPGTLA